MKIEYQYCDFLGWLRLVSIKCEDYSEVVVEQIVMHRPYDDAPTKQEFIAEGISVGGYIKTLEQAVLVNEAIRNLLKEDD